MKQESVTPIGPDGEATGPTEYTLRITHEEMHLVYWAIRVAEAFRAHDDAVEALGSVRTYIKFRNDFPSECDSFVDKFDVVHTMARKDDGEEV